MTHTTDETPLADERELLDEGLDLLAVGPGFVVCHALPSSGVVVVGRSDVADLKIDDPLLSRRHAALHVGPELRVEDLGSANGTRVRERPVPPGDLVGVVPGDPIFLGDTMLVVQPRVTPVRTPVPPAAAMQRVQQLAQQVAAGMINVLILGETGVGKEVLAEKIHQLSPRAAGPLVRLDCAALPEALLESELFGHERGAFTGATHAKAGLLESAEGGTVFLDEVGELPPTIQAKLLRTIDAREVRRVGSVRAHTIDVRFLAATNRDLEEEVASGTFRSDLFFRLGGAQIVIPPLRERVDEIAGLASQFVARATAALGRSSPPTISAPALALLERHAWPGNVRELRNVMERAVLLCSSGVITGEHLPIDKPRAAPPSLSTDGGEERQRIIDALARCGGNQKKAADLLGLSRQTLLRRLRAYTIPRPRKD